MTNQNPHSQRQPTRSIPPQNNTTGIETTPRGDRTWSYWPIVPLYPYGQPRRTLRQEVVKNTIWTFEQLQGILHVIVPIRMSVLRLTAGGLLVYAPVAPTKECLRLLQEIIDRYGPIKYIILPTASGIEHKVFVGPFARHFPAAQVYVAPHQWSFPIDLPWHWLGLPKQRTQALPANPAEAPFAEEFDYTTLGPINLRLGEFEEIVLYHRRSRTLLVTDTIIALSETPPDILQLDPYHLLFHAKDNAQSLVSDTLANRKKGWQRICLFALYFQPSALSVTGLKQTWQDSRQAGDRSKQAYFGLFPVQWHPDWQTSFAATRGDGRLFVAPILQKLVLNRDPKSILAGVNQIATWNFQQIIPCHFDCPIKAGPQEFCQAFHFLEQDPSQPKKSWWRKPVTSLPTADFQTLENINQVLQKRKIIPPEQS